MWDWRAPRRVEICVSCVLHGLAWLLVARFNQINEGNGMGVRPADGEPDDATVLVSASALALALASAF